MMLLTINGGKCQGNIIECGIWIANNSTYVNERLGIFKAQHPPMLTDLHVLMQAESLLLDRF